MMALVSLVAALLAAEPTGPAVRQLDQGLATGRRGHTVSVNYRISML